MRRIVARFEDDESAAAARSALQEAGYSPETPPSDNPFFDPSARLPEVRGLLWGGLFGGVLGAIVLAAVVAHVLWIPRLSPIMTAGSYTLVALGFGLGAVVGGFVGGAIGTSPTTGVPRPRIDSENMGRRPWTPRPPTTSIPWQIGLPRRAQTTQNEPSSSPWASLSSSSPSRTASGRRSG